MVNLPKKLCGCAESRELKVGEVDAKAEAVIADERGKAALHDLKFRIGRYLDGGST